MANVLLSVTKRNGGATEMEETALSADKAVDAMSKWLPPNYGFVIDVAGNTDDVQRFFLDVEMRLRQGGYLVVKLDMADVADRAHGDPTLLRYHVETPLNNAFKGSFCNSKVVVQKHDKYINAVVFVDWTTVPGVECRDQQNVDMTIGSLLGEAPFTIINGRAH